MKKRSAMKTLSALCAALLLIIVCFCSCDIPRVMRKTPICGRIEPAHCETSSTLEYVAGHWIPVTKTGWVEDEYYILYELVLSNDETVTRWMCVSEDTYREWEASQ